MRNYINEWASRQKENNDKITLTRMQIGLIAFGVVLMTFGLTKFILYFIISDIIGSFVAFMTVIIGYIITNSIPIPKPKDI